MRRTRSSVAAARSGLMWVLVLRQSSRIAVMRSTSAEGASGCFSEAPATPVIANQFVQADRDGLAQVHRDVFVPGGNADEPVAVAEVRLRKSVFLRAKQQGHAAGLHSLRGSGARHTPDAAADAAIRGAAPPSSPPPACNRRPPRPRSCIPPRCSSSAAAPTAEIALRNAIS